LSFKRQPAAVIGIAGAVGAFGGFLIQVAFRQASLDVSALMKAAKDPAEKAAIAASHQDWSVSALWVFTAGYVVLAVMTYMFYLRRGAAHRNV
jgi:NNP family nitrate/nitrite transporter-like MFS transporter